METDKNNNTTTQHLYAIASKIAATYGGQSYKIEKQLKKYFKARGCSLRGRVCLDRVCEELSMMDFNFIMREKRVFGCTVLSMWGTEV